MNKLYYGDNLEIMRHMKKGSVDLIYLDPPFNSKRNYNIMYKNMTSKPVSEQVEAFCDTWEMDADKERAAKEMPVLMREYGIDDCYVQFWRLWVQALRNTQPHLLAYLIYMVERLLHMKIILKPTGSIYLHCDPTASHYIKVMMDGVFGHSNFRNEIVWERSNPHSDARRYGNNGDRILFYVKSNNNTWNRQTTPLKEEYVQKSYRDDKNGRKFRPSPLDAESLSGGGYEYEWNGHTRIWRCPIKTMETMDKMGEIYYSKTGLANKKIYLDKNKGIPLQSIWTDIPYVRGKQNLGYPTQKPISLLDRIILSSTNEGDVVFDPFCGCGTTIYSANKNNREWVGCDIAILAIKLIRHVLGERYRLSEGDHFEVDGIPASVEQALELFKHDPFQFEHWIVERVGAFPTKKTGDKGIDGRMYFETRKGLKDMIFSVKGGTIRPTDIRDLRGVLERESNAELAGFISMKNPTKSMREEAATAGTYTYSGIHYDRIQLLTIKDIIEDKKHFHSPSVVGIKEATGQLNLPI